MYTHRYISKAIKTIPYETTALLCINQFGFRPGHSTELAALRLVDHLIAQMDVYNVPTNIYIDLSKAFDTLDHSILLSKLKYYGITGCSYKLLSSYLTDRSQYVDFSGHNDNDNENLLFSHQT